MPKVAEIQNDPGAYIFECPGCGFAHKINTLQKDDGWPVWRFNNNLEKPTVTPSILVRYGRDQICHSFVTDGNIQFLNDCTHSLAGKTVELTELDHYSHENH